MPSPPDPLSATLSALSDPTRRAIVARLSRGEATVNELAAPFDLSLPAVSKHLSVLERSGLIERRRREWEERLDRLDDYLTKLQVKQDPRAGKHKNSR